MAPCVSHIALGKTSDFFPPKSPFMIQVERNATTSRPVSAPPGRAKRRPQNISNDYPNAVLIPNSAYVSTTSAMSGAELQAWATLGDSSVQDARPRDNTMRRPRQSKSMVTFDTPHPSCVITDHQPKETAWAQPKQQQGVTPAATAIPSRTPRSSLGQANSTSRKIKQTGHSDTREQVHSPEQSFGGYRTAVVEPDSSRREIERNRSEISIR